MPFCRMRVMACRKESSGDTVTGSRFIRFSTSIALLLGPSPPRPDSRQGGQAAPFRGYAVARMLRTGHGAVRTTRSAVLPMIR